MARQNNSPASVRYIDLREFVEEGFLQEANRQFFHPLGLALEVSVTTGRIRVWDCREDPEGVLFADGVIDARKTERVEAERSRHVGPRKRMIGTARQN